MSIKHILILGGGSAAISAAQRALGRGVQVTMINQGLPLGGTCLNVGCVPSKFFIRAADHAHQAGHARFKGVKPRGADIQFSELVQEKTDLVDELRRVNYEEPLPATEGLTLLEGHARFLDAQRVEVEGQALAADRFIIATGATTSLPPVPGLSDTPYLTNETLFDLAALPESMIVLGGSYIALEAAQMFARLGSKVTVIQRSAHVLSSEHPGLADDLTAFLREEGITIICGTHLLEVQHQENQFQVFYTDADGDQEACAAQLFVATGRRPHTDHLGLEAAGVEVREDGAVQVDDFMRTSAEHIYAAGDVIGDHQFVYTASYEAELAVDNALGAEPRPRDYTGLPWVVFTDPQVAGVGLDEEAARRHRIPVETAEYPVSRWPRFRVARETRGYIRLFRNPDTDELLGARVLAPEGGDLVSELGLAIRYNIPVRALADFFHPYLTLSEGIQRAAMKFYG